MLIKYSTLRVPSLTISLASFSHQQFHDAKETLSCGQVQRTITHFTTRIHICPKLQQQLCQL